MASFLKGLRELLAAAREQGLVAEEASEAMLRLAEEQDRKRHFLSATGILGWLGGGVAAVGVSLLIAANWREIPGGVRVLGFLVLLGAVHGGGLYIRWKNLPYTRTAHALHFMGAALFLAGIGLVAQVYNLHSKPPNGILLWLLAIVPLAVLLRSGPITAMSLFALLLWAHLEGVFPESPVAMRDTFMQHLLFEMALGVALVGFGGALRNSEPQVAVVMRAVGVFLVTVALYTLGFFRYFSHETTLESAGGLVMPVSALALAAAGLVVGWHQLSRESPRVRAYLVGLLVVMLVVAGAAAAADLGLIPRGAEVRFFHFGWYQHFDTAEWLLTVGAWLVWFVLALWCIGYGTIAGRKAFLNLGVVGVGLGVVTRFFDLAGSLGGTGWVFVVGGVVLLGTGWAMERWRRYLIARMKMAE